MRELFLETIWNKNEDFGKVGQHFRQRDIAREEQAITNQMNKYFLYTPPSIPWACFWLRQFPVTQLHFGKRIFIR
jgi:hypothetical protein